jgi:dipeptidase D
MRLKARLFKKGYGLDIEGQVTDNAQDNANDKSNAYRNPDKQDIVPQNTITDSTTKLDEFEGIETTENIEFFAENVETPKMQVPAEIQDNLVDAIYACHDGVLRMAPSMPEIVETSSNLAIVEIGDGKAAIKILARSSHEYYKMYLATMIESCFNMAGMKVEFSGSYMGWNPNPKSDILEHVLKVYKEQNGTDGKVQAVHAGLECSIILSKYPNLDVVSFGPTLLSPHTANERCQISCVAPFWNLVKQLLTEIPAK